ncbi:type II and III secretion system protein family protein [Novosphingobium cyanobacteriorum]|uniref:Type II and III secretion system protein family protein n=1 Tax=Novosphingobium cyanobacteriorum TaxID=3024215 RepID=A0ABT6CG45_9SPHN|nr:type II and III secretion system protein family protein [Novosphingobium cyanobacteriorum]MDF8332479.1 type II and III secretion system protein family protein [Novosphingobium cyanobacteriorum]
MRKATQIAPALPLAKGKTMKARIASSLISAVVLAAPLAAIGLTGVGLAGAAKAQSVTSPARSIALSIGRGELVTLPGSMKDVFVANDQIADVQVKSLNQLYIFGKAGGETTVYASNARGDVVWSANVRVGTNIDSIDQMLHLAMPEARIATSTMNNTVLLTGTVAAPEDAAEAERLVKAFVGDKINVISRLKMATPLQVSLHVKFAEVSRTLLRNISANLASVDSTGGFKFGLGQGRGFYPQYVPGGALGMGTNVVPGATTVTPLNGQTTLAGQGKLFGLDLLGALDLGETIGLVATLSEPNLTALSGETADFLAGGEYPIPISQGLGTTSVEYKKYGVSLSYTPTVLANGRISIRVRPEVSELSADGAVALNGYSIPALTIRRAETTVELGSGQSFMIAGLLRNGNQDTITKMPGAGDIPILGSLFRSTAFKKGETELVIVVTPYLVNPVDANDIKLPTDGYKAADALQHLLLNQNADGVTGGERPKPSEKQGSVQPGPKVGALDVPQQPAEAALAPRQSRRPGKDKQASAATPGFSIQ